VLALLAPNNFLAADTTQPAADQSPNLEPIPVAATSNTYERLSHMKTKFRLAFECLSGKGEMRSAYGQKIILDGSASPYCNLDGGITGRP